MVLTVGDMVRIMEDLAPTALAEEWDNVGLQVGSRRWAVDSVMVALDPSPDVVSHACRQGASLLVTHHPLLFRPTSRIDVDSPQGRVIQQAIDNRMAILTAHTNLDSVTGGINDVLAERLGLQNVRTLEPARTGDTARVDLIVPETIVASLSERLGDIVRELTGTDRAIAMPTDSSGILPMAAPAADGSAPPPVRRIELVLPQHRIKSLISRLQAAFRDRPLFYDVRPLANTGNLSGLGRVGELAEPVTLSQWAGEVKRRLNLPSLRMVGQPEQMVRTAALCSGSGGSLLSAFFASGADVFITGDIRYHDARTVEERQRGLLGVGHFESEHLMTAVLADRLERRLSDIGLRIPVGISPVEVSPFRLL